MTINFLSLAALGMLINTPPHRLPLTQLVINNNYFQNHSFTITKIENKFVETVIIMCVVGGQQGQDSDHSGHPGEKRMYVKKKPMPTT